jgi:hypothetical protein
MASGLIIKPDPDRDEYVAWSTIVEAPVCLGSADQLVAFFAEHEQHPEEKTRERLARADATGTSSMLGDGAFGDYMIFEQRGRIACSKLADLARCLIAEDLDGAYDLCEPFDDETEVRRE